MPQTITKNTHRHTHCTHFRTCLHKTRYEFKLKCKLYRRKRLKRFPLANANKVHSMLRGRMCLKRKFKRMKHVKSNIFKICNHSDHHSAHSELSEFFLRFRGVSALEQNFLFSKLKELCLSTCQEPVGQGSVCWVHNAGSPTRHRSTLLLNHLHRISVGIAGCTSFDFVQTGANKENPIDQSATCNTCKTKRMEV